MRSPIAWWNAADLLKACAETIAGPFVEDLATRGDRTYNGIPPHAYGPVFQMLAGYTLEAMLKGIIVGREPEIATTGTLYNHRLGKLFQRAGVNLDAESAAFVRRLEAAILWVGRYPAPKTADQMQTIKFSSTGDIPRFQALYDRLVPALQGVLGGVPPPR